MIYEARGGRADITIDDPDRHNPMSIETMKDLVTATRRASLDEAVRVIVYTGAGDRSFSAGGDLSSTFAAGDEGHEGRGALADLFRLMHSCGKPTIARVNGHALAGGFGLAVACDFTVCVDDAQLGATELKVGLWPMMISAVLVRSMAPKRALGLMMTGRVISPQEALELGAVTSVVPRFDLDREVDALVDTLIGYSPAALRIGKSAFYEMLDLGFDQALERLQAGLTDVMSTDDAVEGMQAFLDKRPPKWSGK